MQGRKMERERVKVALHLVISRMATVWLSFKQVNQFCPHKAP